MASAERCLKCKAPIGVDIKSAPYDGMCPPCTNRPCAKCGRCGVHFVDLGFGVCPFCRHHVLER